MAEGNRAGGGSPRVIVLGLTPGGLALGRAFHDLGFRPLGVHARSDECGRFSRVFERVVRLPEESASVVSLARPEGGRAILVPTSDHWLAALMEAAESLPPGIVPIVPPPEVYGRWFSKERYPLDDPALAGLLAPPRSAPLAAWRTIAEGPGRWIVKPVNQVIEAAAGIGKNVLLEDVDALARFAAEHAPLLDFFIVQEYIEGDDDAVVFTGGYVNRHGQAHLLQSSRKIWQSLSGRGVTIVCRLESVPGMEERVRAFLRSSGIRGMFEAEWKWDAESGQWRFIEVNLRGWLTLGLSRDRGRELARLILSDHGLPPGLRDGVEAAPQEWRDDVNLMVQAMKGRRLSRRVSAGPVAHAYWLPGDPLPFAAHLWYTLKRRLSRNWRARG